MIKYLIIDDEPIAHRIIEGYCKDQQHLYKAGNCYNALEAAQLLHKESVDLIFLDINMPKITGFEFLKTLPFLPKIIVTSAYQEYALEGYELDICDYLLKPFSFERFMKAVNKAIISTHEVNSPVEPISQQRLSRIFVKGSKKQYQIALEDILYIEAYGNYTKIFLRQEMIITHEKISYFEALLPPEVFLRVHKSFIVSIDKINIIEGNKIRIGDHTIPIGQTYKANVDKLYGF